MKNEGDVKKAVKKALDQHGWFWFMPPANGYGRAGIADILAIKTGVFIAIETKFGTKKPTALQVGFLNSVRAEDGFAFVVDDRNIDWFDAFLGAFARSVDKAGERKQPEPEDGAMMLNAIAELTRKLHA